AGMTRVGLARGAGLLGGLGARLLAAHEWLLPRTANRHGVRADDVGRSQGPVGGHAGLHEELKIERPLSEIDAPRGCNPGSAGARLDGLGEENAVADQGAGLGLLEA